MSYSDQALLSVDQDFMTRLAACAAVEIELGDEHPMVWSARNQWAVAASPGFADKYAYAIATGVNRPGNDPAVISDGDILSAVQALEAETVPE